VAFDDISRNPLQWPIGWPRTPSHKVSRSPFSKPRREGDGAPSYVCRTRWTVYAALEEVKRQLKLLGVDQRQIVFSSNMPQRQDGLPISKAAEPRDSGVAVYFVLKNEPHALACDRWDRVGDNLRAIGLHIDAIRGMDRWGVGSIAQAFAGYGVKQLAEMGARKAWWEVLGMKEQPTSSTAVQERFHQLALKHHPDRGGHGNQMAEISAAYEEGLRALST
jgi:hypothetical protein